MAHVPSRREVLTTLAASLLGAPVLANARLGLAATQVKQVPVYVGTYTEGTKSQGIYRLLLDLQAGALGQPAELVAQTPNPSFLALHPTKPLLYAVNEVTKLDDKAEGGVSSFKIGDQGALLAINRQPSDGTAPCHLSITPGGTALLVANYASGTLGMKTLDPDSGAIQGTVFKFEPNGTGPNQGRQEGPHAHCVRLDPSGQFAAEADLGIDRVHIFRVPGAKEAGTPLQLVNKISAKPGSGPRHLAFHPSGRFLFVNGEMDTTLSAYRFDPQTGGADLLDSLSTLPPGDHPGSSTAETVVHPSGKFVYVSNRGHNTVARFGFDAATAKLTALGHTPTGGKTPRNINIDPTGNWLLAANQESNTITVFRINTATGDLTQVGQPVDVPAPVCMVFDAARISG